MSILRGGKWTIKQGSTHVKCWILYRCENEHIYIKPLVSQKIYFMCVVLLETPLVGNKHMEKKKASNKNALQNATLSCKVERYSYTVWFGNIEVWRYSSI